MVLGIRSSDEAIRILDEREPPFDGFSSGPALQQGDQEPEPEFVLAIPRLGVLDDSPQDRETLGPGLRPEVPEHRAHVLGCRVGRFVARLCGLPLDFSRRLRKGRGGASLQPRALRRLRYFRQTHSFERIAIEDRVVRVREQSERQRDARHGKNRHGGESSYIALGRAHQGKPSSFWTVSVRQEPQSVSS
jgi:hypothetical protein